MKGYMICSASETLEWNFIAIEDTWYMARGFASNLAAFTRETAFVIVITDEGGIVEF